MIDAVAKTLAVCLSFTATGALAQAETAQSAPVVFSLDYTLDQVSVVQGGLAHGGRHLDALSLGLDADLDRAFGWSGATAHIELSNTSGRAPGELAGAAQGIDNIEVGARRLRLYQAYLEKSFAEDKVNLRVGFSDLSGEFAVADASGVLINPSFGMAAEFAASGAAAFPSTSMGARLRVNTSEVSYVQVAVSNAQAGVPGDAGGADFSFDNGEIIVAEAGWIGRGKVAAGYWRYTERFDDLVAVDASGEPVRKTAQGGYAVVEQPIVEAADGARAVTGFLRVGVADGRTNPFRASWQAGALVAPVFLGRPESSASFGVSQARFGKAYREGATALGINTSREETVFELAYSDQLTKHVRIQPDIQFVHRPAGVRAIKDAVVVSLRLNIGF